MSDFDSGANVAPEIIAHQLDRGYCLCGCGRKTDLAHKTDRNLGWIKGQPKRFVYGHHGRKWKSRSWINGSPTGAYLSWRAMRQRTRSDWKCSQNYADRGIAICDRWKSNFDNFLEDMGERPEGMSLDRIDNDKGYEPGNCRWANMGQQNNNKRSNVRITVDGLTLTCAEWSRKIGISKKVIWFRLNSGWPPEEAVTLPRYSRRNP